MQLGRIISKYRLEKGLSQEKLSAITGIAQQQISKLESGDDIRLSSLTKIIDVLEIPINEILYKKEGENVINSSNVIKPIQISCNFNINISEIEEGEIEKLLETIHKFKNL